LILQVLHGERPELAAEQREEHDYIFVEDVVEALLLAGRAEDHAGAVCDVCTGELTSDRELLEALEALSSSSIVDPEYVQRENPYREQTNTDPGEALEVLGFEPRTAFDEALARTFDWFNERYA
jgi:nucleoside-diphosphate-sugar epimerase